MSLSQNEEKIVNRVQKDIPFSTTPFRDLADELQIPEEEILGLIMKLKEGGLIRNIAGIFNAGRLGYLSTLVALSVPDSEIQKASMIINSHPGVSHNYLRSHEFNIWFTLAVDSEEKLEPTVKYLAEQCGAADFLLLKNEKMYKIGVHFTMGKEGSAAASQKRTVSSEGDSSPLTADEKEAVRLLQCDLPLEHEPFTTLIELTGTGLSVEALLKLAGTLIEKNIMRRYAAVVRHHKAGYNSNAMTVWRPENLDAIDEIAEHFIAENSISHLYLRSIYPGRWEYPLFAMIHARSDDELRSIIKGLADKSGITDYQALTTVQEFKKERMTYFSKQFNEWEIKAGL